MSIGYKDRKRNIASAKKFLMQRIKDKKLRSYTYEDLMSIVFTRLEAQRG